MDVQKKIVMLKLRSSREKWKGKVGAWHTWAPEQLRSIGSTWDPYGPAGPVHRREVAMEQLWLCVAVVRILVEMFVQVLRQWGKDGFKELENLKRTHGGRWRGWGNQNNIRAGDTGAGRKFILPFACENPTGLEPSF